MPGTILLVASYMRKSARTASLFGILCTKSCKQRNIRNENASLCQLQLSAAILKKSFHLLQCHSLLLIVLEWRGLISSALHKLYSCHSKIEHSESKCSEIFKMTVEWGFLERRDRKMVLVSKSLTLQSCLRLAYI